MYLPFSRETDRFLDVILTPLKPQLKNVTAEDVASSLFYLHLNSEKDAQLLVGQEGTIPEDETPIEVAQKALPRKPLPESAKSSLDLNRQLPILPESSGSTPKPVIARKALATDHQKSVQPVKEQVHRKPLGPRPPLSNSTVNKTHVPRVESEPLEYRTHIQEPTAKSNIESHESSYASNPQNYSPYKISPEISKSFSITLIRRDPSSGSQWNIGTVVGEEEVRGAKTARSKKPYFNVSVHLTNPGYTPFRDTVPSLHCGPQPNSEPGFDRQVRMEGLSFWDRSKKHKRSQSDTTGMRNDQSGGAGITYSHDGAVNAPTSNYSNTDRNDSGTKGYAFTSPWGGRCKFSTSSSGRSLRCKHTLPAAVSASSTLDGGSASLPSAAVSELRFNLPAFAKYHSPISPEMAKGRMTNSGRFQIPKFGHIRNKLSPEKILRPTLPSRPHPTSYAAMYPSDDEEAPPLPPRPFSSSNATESSDDYEEEAPSIPERLHPFPYTAKSASEEEDEARLDLSIGQEKAGGGNRGKRAKLGKLILHDEGLKMLDLCVAVNAGIWWSVWESSF